MSKFKEISLFDKVPVINVDNYVVDYEKEFIPCKWCNVLPEFYRSDKPSYCIDGHTDHKTIAFCPKCGYTVATFYNIYEHWNSCMKYLHR